MTRAAYFAVGCAIAVGLWVIATTWVFVWKTTGIVDGLTTLLPVPIAFLAGFAPRRWVGLAAPVWIALTVEVTQGWNPFVLVVTFGPWLAGLLVYERQQVARQLVEVGRQIEEESERLAEEAVRLERARIARELHDIVAHCVSVMVVQAYAGERLVSADSASAAEAFDHIADQAGQAQREIAHLVELLVSDAEGRGRDLAPALAELVRGAEATGLHVDFHLSGRPEELSSPVSAVAYRVVQESVTNALKHAPGAPIIIRVHCDKDVTVDVLNGGGVAVATLLGQTGGGHGLAGIRERVTGLGGTFEAGPDAKGSWRVSVSFPAA